MPLIDLLSRQPAAALAILSPERPPLTYGGLAGLAGRTVAALNGRGIGRRDRVAIVLPNGPEMAAAFLAIGAGAATAPAQPGLSRADEFDFYLRDLEPKALVVAGRGGDPGPRGRPQARHPRDRAGAAIRRPAGLLPAGDPGGAAARRQLRRAARTSPSCCTPPAPPRGRRSCRCRSSNILASAQHIGADAGAGAGRPLPQHHAAVPYPRPDRRRAVHHRRRRQRLLHAGIQRAEVLRLARGGRSPPGTPRCRPCIRRSWPAPSATGRSWSGASCASSAPPPPRCRRRS